MPTEQERPGMFAPSIRSTTDTKRQIIHQMNQTHAAHTPVPTDRRILKARAPKRIFTPLVETNQQPPPSPQSTRHLGQTYSYPWIQSAPGAPVQDVRSSQSSGVASTNHGHSPLLDAKLEAAYTYLDEEDTDRPAWLLPMVRFSFPAHTRSGMVGSGSQSVDRVVSRGASPSGGAQGAAAVGRCPQVQLRLPQGPSLREDMAHLTKDDVGDV